MPDTLSHPTRSTSRFELALTRRILYATAMRYSKGSLVLNPRRDLPALRRVLNARFIAHSQLFEFMRLCYADQNRQVFNWRMRRFVHNGLVQSRKVPYVVPEPIYSITQAGGLALESHGELPFAAWGYKLSAPKELTRPVRGG